MHLVLCEIEGSGRIISLSNCTWCSIKKHERSIKKQATWPAQTDLFESQKRGYSGDQPMGFDFIETIVFKFSASQAVIL